MVTATPATLLVGATDATKVSHYRPVLWNIGITLMRATEQSKALLWNSTAVSPFAATGEASLQVVVELIGRASNTSKGRNCQACRVDVAVGQGTSSASMYGCPARTREHILCCYLPRRHAR
jgi:hypothetical protein